MNKNPYDDAIKLQGSIPNFVQIIDDLMELGLSQSEIARRIGCGQSAISRIQLGQRQDPQASVAFPLHALWKQEMANAKRRKNRRVA